MEEAPENGKESPHSAHASGMCRMNYDENLSVYTKRQVHFLIQRDIPVFLEIC